MGFAGLDRIVREYLDSSLAPSTASTYRSAINRYFNFCTPLGISPLPVTHITVARFVAHLAHSGVSYPTIKVYLSGLRFLQVRSGLPDPELSSDPFLSLVLRGIQRCPPSNSRAPRAPVTPEMLSLLFSTWSAWPEGDSFDASMLWAACCLGFFGFLRAGEFTCPSRDSFRPHMLGPQDISVDSHLNPTRVSVFLARSKTDPFGTGVTVHIGRTGHTICPVAAILSFLVRRGRDPGPLFLFQDGTTLSRGRLVRHVHQALEQQGVPSSGVSGHSFRIGAATAAARAGLEDSLIQALGRWTSSAYLRYIRTPPSDLAEASAQLLNPLTS